jgi:hypothetical protein
MVFYVEILFVVILYTGKDAVIEVYLANAMVASEEGVVMEEKFVIRTYMEAH